jgi:hypothetical protein
MQDLGLKNPMRATSCGFESHLRHIDKSLRITTISTSKEKPPTSASARRPKFPRRTPLGSLVNSGREGQGGSKFNPWEKTCPPQVVG